MGNSSSRVIRAFPKRSPAPWAGARTPAPPETGASGVSRASGQRTADIDDDARDPDFLAALNKLGPVRIDHHHHGTQDDDSQMNHINRRFRSRAASEDEASSLRPSHNHLYAGSLHELLNERKSVCTQQDLERLADKYNIDVARLERLARFVTSPSVDGNLTVTRVDRNGDVAVTLTAVWANPRIRPT